MAPSSALCLAVLALTWPSDAWAPSSRGLRRLEPLKMSQPTESQQDTPFDAPASLDAPPGGVWADFWYNCNQILCLGNALDDDAYRGGFATVVGITFLLSSNSPAVRAFGRP